ncbi:MaoC family dehydratase [Gordonia sp. L191]|uniref:MaoC family dehydratase n=1 Tax=Gordonia sp. L191 TaxID=2982699 RepID=UPI0024BFEC73|nr:MaoC family dehydratase [Gordonia sp. L191]WHU46513.1 MaoC family dehydratase [Gordonia sp. L191]
MTAVETGEVVRLAKTVTEFDVYGFAGITGDFYPLHIDAEYAQEHPAGARVAHGVLILGLMSAAAGQWMTRREVDGYSYGYDTVRFIKPVYLGDTISVTFTVKGERPEEGGKILCAVDAHNQHGELVAVATHVIWLN